MTLLWFKTTGKTPPLVKWSGGKTSELPNILPFLPSMKPKRVLEPFFGGGALGLSLPADVPLVASDISRDLINLYCHAQGGGQAIEPVFQAVDALLEAGAVFSENICERFVCPIPPLRALASRLRTTAGALGQEIEESVSAYVTRRETKKHQGREARRSLLETRKTAAIGGIYRVLRRHSHTTPHGTATRAALFWFVRDFAFNGMHRFNQSGEPNVPYGGASYNKKRMLPRLQRIQSSGQRARLLNTEFVCADFSDMINRAGSDDLVFLDPPYDCPFANYDGNQFSKDDHLRLARHLEETSAKWLMVIGVTDFVLNTYSSLPGIFLHTYQKKYRCNIKNRHGRETTHVIIRNYQDGSSEPGA